MIVLMEIHTFAIDAESSVNQSTPDKLLKVPNRIHGEGPFGSLGRSQNRKCRYRANSPVSTI